MVRRPQPGWGLLIALVLLVSLGSTVAVLWGVSINVIRPLHRVVAHCEQIAAGKLKKDVLGDTWNLRLVRNPDILGEVVPRYRDTGLRVVGFALETEDVVARALGKLRAKGLDFIVANSAAAAGSGRDACIFEPGDQAAGPAGAAARQSWL